MSPGLAVRGQLKLLTLSCLVVWDGKEKAVIRTGRHNYEASELCLSS